MQTRTNENVYDSIKLATMTFTKVEELKKYIADNNLSASGEYEPLDKLASQISDLSKNQKKKLNKYLRSTKRSYRYMNSFFGFLYRNVLKSNNRIKVKPSAEEQAIQASKKAWKEARDKAEALLLVYKETKGDFYKQ